MIKWFLRLRDRFIWDRAWHFVDRAFHNEATNKVVKMIDLKPCPFCGREGVLFSGPVGSITKHIAGCSAEDCSSTGCPVHPQTGWCYSEDEAVKAWNLRKLTENTEDGT